MNENASTNACEGAPHEHSSRLLQGMADVVQMKAYGDITIADIVRAAGVSKRSFYEHFQSKEACFLALYAAASASALRTLRASLDPDQPWEHQIEHGLNAYFEHLSAGPGLLRALFIDIHFLGEAGSQARRAVMQGLADYMLDTVNGDRHRGSEHHFPKLSPTMALATVGSINELVLDAVERGAAAELPKLTTDAVAVVRLLSQV